MKDLYVGWDEYHRIIEELTLQVYESGYRFDVLLCLARGGLRVGDLMSRIFDVPLAILATSSYREAAGREQGALDIAECITKTGGSDLSGRVLLVDDLVDSGETLLHVVNRLRQRFTGVTDVRSAVLWYKAVSRFKPDYFVHYLPDSPWIHQPFEEYETLQPQQLPGRVRRA